MNYRLTGAAAVATMLAATAEFSLIHGAEWYVASAIGVLIVALAGTVTRLSPIHAAIGATVLGGVAVVPMIAAHSLYWKLLGAAIVVCCATSAFGLRPLRAVAGLVTYLSALLLYVNAQLAGRWSLGLLIPTLSSLRHLVHLASAGIALTKYQPPANGNYHSIQLLAMAGIGLAAIVVDLLAVRLRKPAIAGLPLLVVFMAPITTTAHVGGVGEAFTFLLAAIGYLALLSSDGRNRLRGWGRVVTVWHNSGEDDRLGGADMGTLTATGRKIGFAAVGLAIVAPLILPTLNPARLFSHGTGVGTNIPVGLPDPVDQLHNLLTLTSPHEVLTYRSSADDPGNYLQVYVLNYDKSLGDWNLVEPNRTTAVGSHMQFPTGLTAAVPQTIVTSHITLGQVTAGYEFPIFFLPVPYWPTRITAPGSWREADGTLMIFSEDSDHAGQSYTVTNDEPDPTAGDLSAEQVIPNAIASHYLGFSSSVTPELTRIADHVTRGANTSYAKAVALEEWFHSGRFTYSLHPDDLPNSAAGLLKFLTKSPQGYCQQFAFAMAVLARLVGIPSRVAVGYTAGTRRQNGTWVVTTNDAHAWPELYFTSVGWVRFEPTPGGTGGQATAVQPSYATPAGSGGRVSKGGGSSSNTSPGGSSTASAAPKLPIHKIAPGLGTGTGTVPTSQGSGSDAPIWWAVLAVLVVAAAAPGTLRLLTRRRRWRSGRDDVSAARAAWQELCADLEDYGMRSRPSESPRALARRVSSVIDGDDAALQAARRIATVVERSRYAPVPQPAGAIRADVVVVRRALAHSSTRMTRVNAKLLPPSTLRPISAAVRHRLGQVTGWVPAAAESA